MTNPVDDPSDTPTTGTTGAADDTDRAHAEDPAEGEDGTARDVPREHSEDPAEG